MRLLAIETSCERASLALLLGSELIVRELAGSGAQHSSGLLPALRALLAEADVAPRTLDVIAFGNGPGAFTGVRLACGVAQGLALGADCPVAPIGSLLALAEASPAPAIYAAMDARMGEVYAALYTRDATGDLIEALAPVVCTPDHVPLPPSAADWQGRGTAFTAHAAAMAQRLQAHVQVQDALAVPTAAAVARLAARNEMAWIDPALAAPLYVRDRVALTIEERLRQGGKA